MRHALKTYTSDVIAATPRDIYTSLPSHHVMDVMDRVTVGVVGDAFVGKTLLCISYTANYVYKEYRPTVLNCYWTNTVVDGHVIDVRIWDNSGSADHVSLRPLSYPQTDVFLVCFSLKCLKSLENVRDVWLPEIEENTKRRVPVLLVGCKRDDCLKSSQDDLDVVLEHEGEEMSQIIGAYKYVETSAIEQSGFTECFHSAIRAALRTKYSATI